MIRSERIFHKRRLRKLGYKIFSSFEEKYPMVQDHPLWADYHSLFQSLHPSVRS